MKTQNKYEVGLETFGMSATITVYKNGQIVKQFIKEANEPFIPFMNWNKQFLTNYTEGTITEYPFNY